MNLPNIITIARLFAVPVVVWAIISGRTEVAFWLFVLAGLSDAVDGYVAKRFGMQSELGAYLDPLADKALLVSLYVTLAVQGTVPVWLAIAVVARDVMIVGAVILSWFMERPVVIRPLIVSKLNTAAQIGFVAVVLASSGFGFALGPALGVGALLVGVLTGISALAYFFEWARHMAVDGKPLP